MILCGSKPYLLNPQRWQSHPKAPGSPAPMILVKGHRACVQWRYNITLKPKRQPWCSLNHIQRHSLFLKNSACLKPKSPVFWSCGTQEVWQPSFNSLFLSSLGPSGSVFVGVIPSLFLASAHLLSRSDQISECAHDLLIKCLVSHTLNVLFKTSFLIFCNMHRLSLFKISRFCFLSD